MEQALEGQKSFWADLSSYNDTVLDVSTSTKDFFFNRHRLYTIGIAVIVVLIELGILSLGAAPPFMILPLALPIIAYVRVYNRMQYLFFTQLAAELGMVYEPFADRTTLSGYFFEIGSGGIPRHVLRGNYQGLPIRLYEYQFTIGSGKHRRTYEFIVSEIDMQGNLPHLFVKPDSLYGGLALRKPPGTKILSLEGNFNDHFDVYVPEDSQIEALQILEPDVMARLIDEFSTFAFECVGTKTYAFKPGSFADNRESLLAHLKLLERLYEELLPELTQLARS